MFHSKNRLHIVGVMGSGGSPNSERATQLGRWLAQRGVHLLTGGGGGTMASVSKAFAEVEDRRGLVIGVIPGRGGRADHHLGARTGALRHPLRGDRARRFRDRDGRLAKTGGTPANYQRGARATYR